ncbi:MAG: hypothetical protein GY913_17025 [Proteobacteria bacterium]|nr:hypothetical protein [Pseudomonadota bacterium]MCP4918608.1 hypothetical protein [Pseudomonadota bacterium]
MLLFVSVSIAGLVTEDRRTYADQSVQERWTWDGEKTDETLVKKEWFHQDGERTRLEEFASGDLHGRVATWDWNGTLQTETHYQAGKVHGAVVEYAGGRDEPWARIELAYVDGVPHGPQLVRHDEDTIERRHNYVDGQLDGPQQAWHSGGEMQYDLEFSAGEFHGEQRLWDYGDLEPHTWMHFEHGQPVGEQRYFIDQDWRTETWTDGRWERVRSWHVEGEVPKSVTVHVLEMVPPDRRMEGGELTEARPDGVLEVRGHKQHIQDRTHHENGVVAVLHERTGDKHYQAWAPNGQLIVEGDGDEHSRVGAWNEWREDGTIWKEQEWTKNRVGEVRVFDAQGRLRETETWEWERKMLWLVLYEGDVRVAEGEFKEHVGRWGSWVHYRPDGSEARIEVWDHGPYSGNRSYVSESEEFRSDGSVRCSGGELQLRCIEPQDDGGKHELTVRVIDRPRHGFESYDRETMTFVGREVTPTVLVEGALRVPALDGEGVVRERKTFDAMDRLVTTETFESNGQLERVAADGWLEVYGPDGLRGLEETHPAGGVCEAHLTSDGLVVVVTRADGSALVSGTSREADRAVAACPLWSRHPEWSK